MDLIRVSKTRPKSFLRTYYVLVTFLQDALTALAYQQEVTDEKISKKISLVFCKDLKLRVLLGSQERRFSTGDT